jgi:hypothetical protein
MMPKKTTPDLIDRAKRFSDTITLKRLKPLMLALRD